MKDSTEITEIEKKKRIREIYRKHTFSLGDYGTRAMEFDEFTQALAEVFEMVKVTDEEIESKFCGYEVFVASWSRDLSQSKLEKLLR